MNEEVQVPVSIFEKFSAHAVTSLQDRIQPKQQVLLSRVTVEDFIRFVDRVLEFSTRNAETGYAVRC